MAGGIECVDGGGGAPARLRYHRSDRCQAASIGAATSLFVMSTRPELDTLVMNCSMKPFDDVRVRQAFKVVVDEQQMLTTVLQGQGAAALGDPVGPTDAARFAPAGSKDIARSTAPADGRRLSRRNRHHLEPRPTTPTTPLALSLPASAAAAGSGANQSAPGRRIRYVLRICLKAPSTWTIGDRGKRTSC